MEYSYFYFFLLWLSENSAERISPHSIASPLRSFPWDIRLHLHCYCSPCLLTFYISHLTLTNLHTLAHAICSPCNILPLPLQESISTFSSNATFSKILSTFFWIYIDSDLHFSYISLFKYLLSHSTVFIELILVFDVVLVVEFLRIPWKYCLNKYILWVVNKWMSK